MAERMEQLMSQVNEPKKSTLEISHARHIAYENEGVLLETAESQHQVRLTISREETRTVLSIFLSHEDWANILAVWNQEL